MRELFKKLWKEFDSIFDDPELHAQMEDNERRLKDLINRLDDDTVTQKVEETEQRPDGTVIKRVTTITKRVSVTTKKL